MLISPGSPKYKDRQASLAFYDEVLRRARNMPGVERAAVGAIAYDVNDCGFDAIHYAGRSSWRACPECGTAINQELQVVLLCRADDVCAVTAPKCRNECWALAGGDERCAIVRGRPGRSSTRGISRYPACGIGRIFSINRRYDLSWSGGCRGPATIDKRDATLTKNHLRQEQQGTGQPDPFHSSGGPRYFRRRRKNRKAAPARPTSKADGSGTMNKLKLCRPWRYGGGWRIVGSPSGYGTVKRSE